MRRLVAISLCAALVAGPALGLELEDCDLYRNFSHGWIVDHQDHGGGIVSYQQTMLDHFNNTGSGRLEVFACQTGEVVWADAFHMPEQGDETSAYDVSDQLLLVLNEMMEAEEVFSFQDVADAFSEISANAGVQVEVAQPCGCNAAYPQLGNYEHQFEWYELWNSR